MAGDRDGVERWTGESGSVRVCSGRAATEVPDALRRPLSEYTAGDEKCSLGGVIRTGLAHCSSFAGDASPASRPEAIPVVLAGYDLILHERDPVESFGVPLIVSTTETTKITRSRSSAPREGFDVIDLQARAFSAPRAVVAYESQRY